jgi:hypothetical protein
MRLVIIVMVAIAVAVGRASGQSVKQNESLVQEIKKLEQAEADALVRNDLAGTVKNWADDYTVNNPRNEVVKAYQGQTRAGTQTYSSFVREIEKILLHGETIIVMGRETVVPKGHLPTRTNHMDETKR